MTDAQRTMTADTLRALIARVEAASGPDRDLDAEIVAALVGGTTERSPINGEVCIYVGADYRGRPRSWEPNNQRGRELRRALIDRRGPTASLDAAASLVPDGWAWTDARISRSGVATVWLCGAVDFVASRATPSLTP